MKYTPDLDSVVVLTTRESMSDNQLKILSNAMGYAQNLKHVGLMPEKTTWTAEGMRALAHFVTRSPKLTDLRIDDVNIGDNGVTLLMQAITKNVTINEIWLDNVGCTTQGAHAIAEAISNKQNIHTVFLNNNALGDEGVIAILDHLNVTRTGTYPIGFLSLLNVPIHCATCTKIVISAQQWAHHSLNKNVLVIFSAPGDGSIHEKTELAEAIKRAIKLQPNLNLDIVQDNKP
jgi:hypothetical protein